MKEKIPGHPIVKVLVVLAVCTLLAAGTRVHESIAGQPEMSNGGKTMLAEKQVYQTDPAVPPIDAQAPSEFETATFGLG